ncbi:MAG: polysaccharide deacetylase family protein [Bacteroidota bacterium]
MTVKNFLFHRVNPERDILWDPMDIELFDKCIGHIKQKYEIITIEDLTEPLAAKKYATISFDDGYKDNIEYALPILEKHKVKASFYVVTDCIDKNIPTWTYILDYLFLKTNKTKIDLNFDFMDSTLRSVSFGSKDSKVGYVKKLKPVLKKLTHEQRNLILDKVAKIFNDVQLPKLMMNWDDLKKLNELGHQVGSHTVSHCMLGTIGNDEEIRYELERSAMRIKEELGFFPKTVSYPVGSYDDATIRLSKEVGYKIGLAVKQDVYVPGNDTIFEVPRIELYNESWFKTRLRISHTLEKIKKVIKYR